MNGYIKVGKPTQGHQATLEKLGYEVQEQDGHFVVEVEGFVDSLDLSQGDAHDRLQEIISNKQALTYRTTVTMLLPSKENPEEKVARVIDGIPMATKLGVLSCLVMKPRLGKSKKNTGSLFSLDDFIS